MGNQVTIRLDEGLRKRINKMLAELNDGYGNGRARYTKTEIIRAALYRYFSERTDGERKQNLMKELWEGWKEFNEGQ